MSPLCQALCPTLHVHGFILSLTSTCESGVGRPGETRLGQVKGLVQIYELSVNPGPSEVVLHPGQLHPPGTKDNIGRYFCLSHWRGGRGRAGKISWIEARDATNIVGYVRQPPQ